jgi:hypothetical protein
MQHFTRQSPVDLPSSSNTSKQSNSNTGNGNSVSNASNQNHLNADVRQITLQFNEIVYQLQRIEESIATQNMNERTP